MRTGKGYYFNRQLGKYQVDFVRDGRHHYVALLETEAEAIEVATQARAASDEGLQWLKEKYSHRNRANGNGASQPLAVTGAPVQTFSAKEVEAAAADEEAAAINREREEALRDQAESRRLNAADPTLSKCELCGGTIVEGVCDTCESRYEDGRRAPDEYDTIAATRNETSSEAIRLCGLLHTALTLQHILVEAQAVYFEAKTRSDTAWTEFEDAVLVVRGEGVSHD